MSLCSLAIFTTCSNNYVPMAKILLETARAHHPDAKLYLCLADKRLPNAAFYPQDCEIIAADDLEIPEFPQFAFRYDVLEFNTALKPFMFLHLLQRGHDAMLYLDPDIEIFAPLDHALQKLAAGASFVLTPHLLQPAEGEAEPDDIAIMRSGVYNLGFLAAGASAEARSILAWWARRLRYQCLSDKENGLFVDQKFIDLVPAFADNAVVLRDTSYNVAYWNLAQRDLQQDSGQWRIDGKELVFFHFSGFDCTDVTRLSKYSQAFTAKAISPSLRALLRHYAGRVTASGYLAARNLPYAYGNFSSGARISYRTREIFRTQYDGWSGDPFTAFDGEIPMLDPTLLPQKTAAELHRQVQAMLTSTSWRVTEPLRALARWLKRMSSPKPQ